MYYYYCLLTNCTLIPSFGFDVTTVFIGISLRSGSGSTKSKSRNTLLSIIFISSIAKCFPMHDRAPAMNGRYVKGCIFGASRPNLSGSNFMGSGQMSARRCSTSWDMMVKVPEQIFLKIQLKAGLKQIYTKSVASSYYLDSYQRLKKIKKLFFVQIIRNC